MVVDSELQRVTRLTPLADVLASFDIGIAPVAAREHADLPPTTDMKAEIAHVRFVP
jgi:hypothetical protein